MKYQSRAVRLIVCLMCLSLIVCLALSPTAAQAAALKTVKVGFFAFDGYHMMDENDQPSGYGYDMLQRMVGYTNWKLEFVGYDKSWSDMQDMLLSGQIDLVTSAQKTKERMELFDFSYDSIGNSATIVTVKAGDTTYATDDYRNWDGIRVGMLKENSRNDSFAAFAAEHGFAYDPVYYDTLAEMVTQLKAGGIIDAIVTSNLRAIHDEWILAQFDTSAFYVMVRKGDTELLAQIDHALTSLYAAEPSLRIQLMNRYYSPDSGEEVPYNAEERIYIESMRGKTLTAILNPDRAPYSYMENGQPTGILYDIAMEIMARSQLGVEFKTFSSREEYLRCVEMGEYDIRLDAGTDYTKADQLNYRITLPYLQAPIARLYLRDTATFRTAALLRQGDISYTLRSYLSDKDIKPVYYSSVKEVTDAVMRGKVDAAYLYSSVAQFTALNEVTNRLVTQELAGYSSGFSVGVNAHLDPTLYAVINKATASIGDELIDEIALRYDGYVSQPFTFIGYMYDYPLHVVLFVATLFVLASLAAMTLYLTKKRKAAAARLIEEERRNSLLFSALSSAENAGKAKSQFLSRVSHEMRTPLNAIIGFLELSKDSDAEKTRSYLDNADIAAKQLLSVINDVLDMSSIESGKLKLNKSPFNFRQLLQAITNVYLPLCEQKNLSFETKILTPIDEWLEGDQLRVNQILMNLLSNAVKFTQRGHVWLSISQQTPSADEVFVRIMVTDTGCGMSEEMQTRLFRPFEQENADTAQKYGGSGLGLSIVKNLVGMMNGAVSAHSVFGEGTTFTVDLPMGKCELEKQVKGVIVSDRMRVLAVDDQENEREYLSIVLERMGVRHTCVADCDDALKELLIAKDQDDAYSICLIDWRMPHIDGIETTRRIREQYGDGVIVIIVSAYEQNRSSDQAKDAGANLFIAKPVFQSTLFDLLMTLTGGRLVKPEVGSDKIDLSGHRVLLAEDNTMNRMVAEGLIRKFGVECDSVGDGRMAVERFTQSEQGYYDTILMDIQMPIMDGYEAVAEIRASQHPQAKSIQVIALTANAFHEDIAKALSAGMNAHVAKPIDPGKLAEALRNSFAVEKNKGETGAPDTF